MNNNLIRQLVSILDSHIAQMSGDIVAISEGKAVLELRVVDEQLLLQLAQQAEEIFAKEPVLLELDPPLVVVGDLHGQLLDLYRILTAKDLPPTTHYLFLGDIVDRGPFSIECLTLILVLKVLYPDYIHVIRGNHEFESVSTFGGFFEQINSLYHRSNLFAQMMSTFNQMPLSAKIGPMLCLHGGISPDLSSLDQIKSLQRPIQAYSDPLVCSILWSDPSQETQSFIASRRGTGFYFGQEPLFRFLENNQLTCLIRGHECVDGIDIKFGNTLITVFSASNYCGTIVNSCGILDISADFQVKPTLYPMIKYLKRESVFYSVPKPLTQNKFVKHCLSCNITTIRQVHPSFSQSHSLQQTKARPTRSSSILFSQNEKMIDRKRHRSSCDLVYKPLDINNDVGFSPICDM